MTTIHKAKIRKAKASVLMFVLACPALQTLCPWKLKSNPYSKKASTDCEFIGFHSSAFEVYILWVVTLFHFPEYGTPEQVQISVW
jgi:hypothetical protein